MAKNTGTASSAVPAPGEDNNKRLAALESGVSALKLALAANGITVGEGGDPLGAAIGVIKEGAKVFAELEDAKALISKLEEAAAADGDATDGEIAAIARAETAEKAFDELAGKIAAAVGELPDGADALLVFFDRYNQGQAAALQLVEAEKELEQLRQDLVDLEEKIAKLEELAGTPEAPPAPRVRPETARDFGPKFGEIDREQLEELIGNSDGFEIAFSNGEHEIVGLEPQPITAAQLRHAYDGRRMVDAVLLVRGGSHREEIHGAALVHGDEQIAYCSFPTPVVIEKGQERRFDRSFIF